jgi:filamentous hemagglutinin
MRRQHRRSQPSAPHPASSLPRPSRLAQALRHALFLSAAMGSPAALAEVPVPIGGQGAFTIGTPTSWVSVGQATAVVDAAQRQLDITQTTDFATYNWQSFNIGADSRVHFQLPQRTSVALNRIFQANPSQIFGALTSNGQVYLINANGFVFGAGARVNVGGLVASALNVAEQDVISRLEEAAAAGRPAFSAFAQDAGAPDYDGNLDPALAGRIGDISVQQGAVITAADGGQVFLFATNVRNDGALVAPDGQVLLGAGDRVYLSRPNDPNLRGFLVEVENSQVATNDLNAFLNGGPGLERGSVSNGGSITAAGGHVSLAGLAVNQTGRINVTKAVNDGGTIRLVAGDVTTNANGSDAEGREQRTRTGERLGRLDIVAAAGATTEVRANSDEGSGGRVTLRAAQTNITAAPGGRIDIAGEDVKLLSPAIDIAATGSVNVTANRMVVSTLDIAPDASSDTLLIDSNSSTPPANFRAFTPNGQTLPSQALVLPANLTLTATPGADAAQVDGGRIFVFAPSITNRASLTANEGQVLLAAGEEVFLGRVTDPDLRGYVAEVRNTRVSDADVTALVNGTLDRLVTGVIDQLGSITAREGAIVLVGPQITQAGSLTTSTSTAVNGGIYLLARDIGLAAPSRPTNQVRTIDGLTTVDLESSNANTAGPISDLPARAARNGALTFASGSTTRVVLEQDGATALDGQQQLPSVVRGTGRRIDMQAGSSIVAPAGTVTLFASATPREDVAADLPTLTNDASLFLADGALVDVSGVDGVVDESQFLVEVQLFSDQLKDVPVQRDGVLFSETVVVDLRNTGLREDGSRWYGTPLADLSNNVEAQPRAVDEVNSIGGYVRLASEGSVVVAEGATVDISGGVVRYPTPTRPTSRVLKDGVSYDIADADPNIRYDLVYDPSSPPTFQQDFGERWGVVQNYGFSPLVASLGVAGSTRSASATGSDAGVLQLLAARTVFTGELLAETGRGEAQREASDASIDPAAARLALAAQAPVPESVEVDASIEAFLAAVNEASRRRPGTELARGGRLIVGREVQAGTPQFRDSYVNDVIVADGALGLLADANGRALANLDAATANAALTSLAASPVTFDGSSRYAVIDDDALGQGRATDITFYANDQIILSAGEAITLDNGSLDAFAARVDVASDVIGAGAHIGLSALPTLTSNQNINPTVTVHDGVTLDVSGRFVNDAVDLAAGRPLAPALIDGGTIDIRSSSTDFLSVVQGNATRGGIVSVGTGTRLLAEGGARLEGNRSGIVTGQGGDVSLIAETPDATYLPGQSPLALAGTISGRAFGRGGTLHLGAPSLCIGGGCLDTAAMVVADADLAPVVNALGADGFSFLIDVAGQPLPEGFLRYELEATAGSLVVAPGAVLAPLAQNYVAAPELDSAATGSTAASVGRFITLPLAQRAPTEVALSQSLPGAGLIGDGTGHTEQNIRDYALVLGRGSRVASDVAGRVELTSDSRMLLGGTVESPAGAISARVTPSDTRLGGLTNQGIWLTDSARLLSRGAVRRRFDVTDSAYSPTQLETLSLGDVLDGGRVSLVAEAGLVATESGSLVDVSAVSAPLGVTLPNGLREGRIVYGDAGEITLEAAEAVLPDGSLVARGAGVAGSKGGSLTVRLDTATRNRNEDVGEATQLVAQLDTASRVLSVVGGSAGSFIDGLGIGESLSGSERGQGFVSLETIAQAGFDSLTLSARNNTAQRNDLPTDPLPQAPGIVRFASSDGSSPVSVNLGAAITVEAGRIEYDGSDVSLVAPYIRMGYADGATALNRPHLDAASTSAGPGELLASAAFLDVIGGFAVSGFAETTLRSASDLRFTGTLASEPGQPFERDRTFDSAMRVNGQLTLEAAAVYPTTLADYTVVAEGADSRVVTRQTGPRSSVTPLSVGGRLRIEADEISHAGSLLAPLGSIELKAADSLEVGAASTTSVSPAGLVLPFGRTEFLLDWVYTVNTNNNLVFDGTGNLGSFPTGSIAFDAPDITVAPGAVIDISAVREVGSVPTMAGAPTYTDPATGRTLVGGDVYAYEFFGGLGGSDDILDEGINPGAFAVVPGFVSGFAPYDPEIAASSTVAFGKAITLAGGAGLPAGTYTVLPARYALLPGAFLVEPVAGSQDFVGSSSPVSDGSVLSAGRFGKAGTAFIDSRTQAFRISPRSTVDERAEYRVSSANDFFTTTNSTTDDGNPRPIDAGRLSLAASASLNIGATLNAQAAPGGFGSLVDIARTGGGALAVVGEGGTSSIADALVLTDAQLNALRANSLLLGGSRSTTAEGVAIDTTANSVVLEAGASLAGGDIILSAREEVRLAAGTSLEGTGGQEDTRAYLTEGNGALARVSGQRTTSVRRTGAVSNSSGDFVQEAGASIAASGAIQVGGTRTTTLDGDIALTAGLLTLEASRFNLGETDGVAALDGLTLNNADLAAITADALSLISATTVDFYGDTVLNAGDVTFDTSALRAGGSDPVNATLSGGRLTLTRSADAVAETASGAAATLDARFERINLGPGEVDLAGFGVASLTASEQFNFAGDGALNVREGSLEVAAGRYTTGAGVTYALNVADGGEAALLATAAAPTGNPASGLGGRLEVNADAVTLGGRFAFPTGALVAQTRSGDINVIAGAELDVSGRAVLFDDLFAGGDGGLVQLTADAGNVNLAAASTVDLSADVRSRDAEAGTLQLLAPTGLVDLQASVRGEGTGGSLVVDARTGDARQFVNAAIGQAFADGLTDTFWLRLREGNWDAAALAAGETLTAQSISVALDGQEGAAGGHFTLAGTLDASGVKGGDVTLDARRSLTLLDGAAILARGTGTPVADTIAGAASVAARGGDGGTVKLRVSGVTSGETVSEAGTLSLASGSLVDVSALDGGQAGTIELRTHRDALTSGGVVLAGELAGGRTEVQAFRVYTDEGTLAGADTGSSTVVGNCGSSRFCTDAAAFMGQAGALKNSLGFGGSTAFDILPEVEIRSAGNLLLSDNWSLHSWRYADPDNAQRWLPGVLTLRAGGNLDIGAWTSANGGTAGRLSDGFNSATLSADADFLTEGVLVNGRDASESWSYRLNAGADYDAASPVAVRPVAALATDADGPVGSVRVANGTTSLVTSTSSTPVTRAVRTGTGSIDVVAAGDIRLGNGASAIYTAGRASSTGLSVPNPFGSTPSKLYPVDGGSLSLMAGQDIVQGSGAPGAAPVRLAVSSFMVRYGGEEASVGPVYNSPVAWTVDFRRFEHGVAALGGGDVNIAAGRDVNSLSASLPSIGRQVGSSSSFADSVVEVIGGGDLQLTSGRDILGGQYYVGLGEGSLTAGGSITSRRTGSDTRLPPTGNSNVVIDTLLVADAARFDLSARQDLRIESLMNSTVLPQSGGTLSFNTVFRAGQDTAYFTYGTLAALTATSAGGSISLEPDAVALDVEFDPLGTVAPAASSLYTVLAPSLSLVSLSRDVAVGSTLTYASPDSTINLLAANDVRLPLDGTFVQSDADVLASTSIALPNKVNGVGAGTALADSKTALITDRSATFQPNRIVAIEGTLANPNGSAAGFAFDFAKPTQIFAGSDIDSLELQVQHLDAGDVSRVVSGGSIFYPAPRTSVGTLNASALAGTGIIVHGPGALEVVAAEDIDLGVADGIDTVGNRQRPNLPDGGADIYALAGLNGQETGYGDFLGWVAESYQALRAASLVAVDPVTRAPVSLPAGSSFRLEGRSEAPEGEFGDPATLVLLNADGSVASRQSVLVITDPVDLAGLFPGASSDAAVADTLRTLLAEAPDDDALLSTATRVLFNLSGTLGGNQSPLENAIREGVNAIRLDVADPNALPQHPIALFYEGIARFFPASGDRNLLRPLLEFALGVTTIDDTASIGERLADAGGSLSALAASNLVAENPDRAPSAEDDGVALSAADAAREAEANRRVFAVRQASIGASVDRLRTGSALDGSPGEFNSLLVAPEASADALIGQVASTGSLGAVAALYNGLLEGQSAVGPSGYDGDISLNFSKINTLDGGDINLLTPGGSIDVGGAQSGFDKRAVELGIVARDGGSVRFFASGETNVNLSRIFATPNSRTPGAESILGVSTTGDIDAGRGSQTALSAPEPLITFDEFGTPRYVLGAALSGSGIRSFDRGARDVFVTPVGVLDTNEAGIFSEGEVVPPPIVVGAAGISAGGSTGGGGGAVAAPAAPDVAAAAVNDATSRATSAGQESVAENSQSGEQTAALGILRVEVLSFFGEGAAEEGEEL